MGKAHWTWEYYHVPDGQKRDPKTNRFKEVRCNYCEHHVTARTESTMQEHLKDCAAIVEKQLLPTIMTQIGNNGSKNPAPKPISQLGVKQEGDDPAVGCKRTKEGDASSDGCKRTKVEGRGCYTLSDHFTMKHRTAETIHFYLLRAFIACNIPFRVLRRPRWKAFLSQLRPAYPQVSHTTIDSRVLQQEHAKVWQSLLSEIHESEGCYTLQLDGWSDKKRRSLYGYTIGKVGELPRVLDVLDISQMYHSSEKLVDVTGDVMDKWMTEMEKVAAVTTDSPNVMVRYRRLLQEKYDHLLVFPCFAHALNLFVKSIVSLSFAKCLLKDCAVIVHYFRASHYWNAWLNEYKRKHSISHGLSAFCETRWYSIIHFLRSIMLLESGLHAALKHSDAVQAEHQLPSHVTQLIKRSLFDNVQVVLSVLEAILDALAAMEKSTASLADCLLQLFRIAFKLRKIKRETDRSHSLFLGQVVDSFNRRYQQFAHPTYALALFLHPMCPNLILADKKKFNNAYQYKAHILPQLLDIAKKWGFTETDAFDLKRRAELYRKGSEAFKDREQGNYDALKYWKNMDPSSEGTLRSFALKLFKLKPTSVEVERLFSHLGAIHTDSRSSMTPQKLKMLAQCKLYYVAEDAKVEETDQSILSIVDEESTEVESSISVPAQSIPTEAPVTVESDSGATNSECSEPSDTSQTKSAVDAPSPQTPSRGADEEAFSASDEEGARQACVESEIETEICVMDILEKMTERATFTPEDVVDLDHPLVTGTSLPTAPVVKEEFRRDAERGGNTNWDPAEIISDDSEEEESP